MMVYTDNVCWLNSNKKESYKCICNIPITLPQIKIVVFQFAYLSIAFFIFNCADCRGRIQFAANADFNL